ncbi:MAG TPA: hypothetical protein VEQ09_07345 [Aquabacterium sp.]|nr:hypothetical protein [Aquabacterium sp.]
MSSIQKVLMAVAAMACAGSVWAAEGAAPAPTEKTATAASAPAPAARVGKRARADWYNTPGWKLMSREERQAHRAKMKGMKSVDECQAYVDQHHAEMVERAKAKGEQLSPERHDACSWLKKKK